MNMKSVHKRFSAEFFISAWDLIEKKKLTKAEKERMIHLAHASLCHWLERMDCTDQNLSIGYWQLSRVYSIAGEAENAIKYAEICRDHSDKEGVENVFLGYAYEALARAFNGAGEAEKTDVYLSKAKAIAELLGKDDKDQLLKDLGSI